MDVPLAVVGHTNGHQRHGNTEGLLGCLGNP
jgi:hypothetical protein